MNFTDLKIYVFNTTALTLSITNIEMGLKIILLLCTIIYTLQRIIKNNEEKKKWIIHIRYNITFINRVWHLYKTTSSFSRFSLQGDTILVAIDKIRPNQYQFYLYSQPYYRPYYYNRYDYQWRYNDNRGVSAGTTSSGNNTPVKAKVTPDITVRPSSQVLKK